MTLTAIKVAMEAPGIVFWPEWVGSPAWLPDGNSILIPME